MNKINRRTALGAVAALAVTPRALAQTWPDKPPHFLVPYPGGGIVDIVARTLAEPMQATLGQTIVVEPKPGGNSTIATALVAQAPADGNTWVMATISHVVAPHLQKVS